MVRGAYENLPCMCVDMHTQMRLITCAPSMVHSWPWAHWCPCSVIQMDQKLGPPEMTRVPWILHPYEWTVNPLKLWGTGEADMMIKLVLNPIDG